jgi:hypothetical protein
MLRDHTRRELQESWKKGGQHLVVVLTHTGARAGTKTGTKTNKPVKRHRGEPESRDTGPELCTGFTQWSSKSSDGCARSTPPLPW